MSNELAKTDPFVVTLEMLKTLPDAFTFMVPDHYFTNISLAEVRPRQRMMRSFEATCHDLGYSIAHSFDMGRMEWVYSLKREKKALDGAIDV